MRPIQDATIQPILNGENCLVIAPTSGGKTEAAVVPALSKKCNSRHLPVSLLYVAPLRALINDLTPRLQRFAEVTEITICRWHSDVPKDIRRAFIEHPSHMLLTTPESLEAFLLFHYDWSKRHFGNIETVVIDEFHAYAGNDRGAHLLALLERLRTDICGDFQRIALSATVGNPHALLADLAMNSKRSFRVIQQLQDSTASNLQIRHARKEDMLNSILGALKEHPKHLIFSENRQVVEQIGAKLAERGTPALVTHSSLPARHREHSEKRFAQSWDHSIVATCVLEMGIDIGDLEHIIQINAPSSVSSFLQRLGRAGRRPGTTKNFTFICKLDFAVLQSTALIQLHQEGYVEPVFPLKQAVHLMAQQLLSLSFSTSDFTIVQGINIAKRAVPFSSLHKRHLIELTEYMQQKKYLAPGTMLRPGERGEKRFGGVRRVNLCTDFQTSHEYTVLYHRKEIGTLDSLFVYGKQEGNFRFTLAAKLWLAMKIDNDRHLIHALPVKDQFDSVWTGSGLPLAYKLCQCMHQILTTEYNCPNWQPSAVNAIRRLRSQYAFLLPNCIVLKRNGKKSWCLFTFAGGKANALIAAVFTNIWMIPATHTNYAVYFSTAADIVPIVHALQKMRKQKRPNQRDAICDRITYPSRLSKFEDCIPPHLKRIAWSEQLFDIENAKRTIQKKLVVA
ncbi:MAG: DEAD/DEAH box helicase [Deltaproteobacteria bacterium]|nr:DEAD/DEAH box helicase [Deltaproteobacteria bacterium]MBN2672933.1 DEAD/DEAH box helicase [Deltaproteobacteria bacterium]